MSDLIAVAYPDRQAAETVRDRLIQMTIERSIDVSTAPPTVA